MVRLHHPGRSRTPPRSTEPGRDRQQPACPCQALDFYLLNSATEARKTVTAISQVVTAPVNTASARHPSRISKGREGGLAGTGSGSAGLSWVCVTVKLSPRTGIAVAGPSCYSREDRCLFGRLRSITFGSAPRLVLPDDTDSPGRGRLVWVIFCRSAPPRSGGRACRKTPGTPTTLGL